VPEAEVCVFCRRAPVDPAHRPFCSERCRLRDLARWVDGDYRIPGAPQDVPDEDEDEGGA
jgi:endogenous inhibitor of DNA gyrase (YacG/DUF329 family)